MNYTFIITHYGAGATVLCRVLNQNPEVIALGTSNLTYDHPTKLKSLSNNWQRVTHRNINVNHCVDKLVLNHQLPSKSFYEICNFIYMIREPKLALANIMLKDYSVKSAVDYYFFRLRRMCEMAAKTGGMLLNYNQLLDSEQRGLKFKEIENKLSLSRPLENKFSVRSSDVLSFKEGRIVKNVEETDEQPANRVIVECKPIYDKYFNFLTSCLRY